MTNEERLVLLKTRRQHAAWCAARDEWREQSGILRSRAGSEGVPRSPLSPDGVVCAMMRRERARRHMLRQRAQLEACQDAARRVIGAMPARLAAFCTCRYLCVMGMQDIYARLRVRVSRSQIDRYKRAIEMEDNLHD